MIIMDIETDMEPKTRNNELKKYESVDFASTISDCEMQVWKTQEIFISVEKWTKKDGKALFFSHDSGELPVVTSPESSDWDPKYFTHWMRLPKAFNNFTYYRDACIRSGLETSVIVTKAVN